MKARNFFYSAPNILISRCLLNADLWEITLDLGSTFIEIPIYFETEEEARKYFNNASFNILTGNKYPEDLKEE